MHEVGMCESLLDAVERRADGRRVLGVKVRIGALHRVVEPSLDQAFELVAAGTVAEGAAVDLVVIPVQATCRSCGAVQECEDVPVSCPTCGGVELELTGGDDFTLESIRLDEPAEVT
jgi:hydrogenase nickel incorporation protein HypA/HybF